MTDLEFFKDKRVVVLGASGLIGSYVSKLLADLNANVRQHVHERAC